MTSQERLYIEKIHTEIFLLQELISREKERKSEQQLRILELEEQLRASRLEQNMLQEKLQEKTQTLSFIELTKEIEGLEAWLRGLIRELDASLEYLRQLH